MFAKHTAFAMEPKELPFQGGTANYGSRKATVQIERSGDLVARMYLVFDLTALAGDGATYTDRDARFTNDIGRALIEEVKLTIGAVTYDTRQGEYYHIWEELSKNKEKHLNRLTGKSSNVNDLFDWGTGVQKIYVPIDFYYTENYGVALPLVSLFQHNTVLEFMFRQKSSLIIAAAGSGYTVSTETGGLIENMVVLCEYIFLENHERNFFVRSSHKYQIEQVQYLGTTSVPTGSSTFNVNIQFNHPTKELIWVFRKKANVTALEWFNFTGEEVEDDAFLSMRILLNSSERFSARDPHYFRQIQPHQHHSAIPEKHIYTYSFALFPEAYASSGSVNFSRIDTAQMRFIFTTAIADPNGFEFHLWGRSINFSRVERGMSKLFFA